MRVFVTASCCAMLCCAVLRAVLPDGDKLLAFQRLPLIPPHDPLSSVGGAVLTDPFPQQQHQQHQHHGLEGGTELGHGAGGRGILQLSGGGGGTVGQQGGGSEAAAGGHSDRVSGHAGGGGAGLSSGQSAGGGASGGGAVDVVEEARVAGFGLAAAIGMSEARPMLLAATAGVLFALRRLLARLGKVWVGSGRMPLLFATQTVAESR